MANWQDAPIDQPSWQDAPVDPPSAIAPPIPPAHTPEEDRLANVRTADTKNKLDLYIAGMKSSSAGLALGKPDVMVPGGLSIGDQLIAGAGQLTGDLPAMIVGSVAGAAAGSETGPGALVSGGAAGAALPTAIRESLMDHYRHGDAVSFQDMVNRTWGITKETLISGTAGAIMGPAGKLVAKPIEALGAGAMTKALTETAGAASAYTAVSSGLHGQVPSADDLLTGGMLAIVTHGAVHGTGKAIEVFKPGTRVMTPAAAAAADHMAEVYTDTGLHPAAVNKLIEQHPDIGQEVLSTSLDGRPNRTSLNAFSLGEPKALADTLATAPTEPTARDKVILESLTKRVADIEQERTVKQAQAGIESRIAPEEKPPAAFKEVADFVKDVPRQTWNKYAPLEKISEGKGAENAGTMMRQTLASPTRAQYMLTHGGISAEADRMYEARSDVPSYKAGLIAFKEAGATREDMRDFMLAKRTIEVSSNGIKTSIDPEDARVFVKAHPEFEKANKILNQARQGKLEYLRASGRISQAQLDALNKNGKDYAPLAVAGETKPGGAKKTVAAPTGLKKIEGQDKYLLQDPVPVDIGNFHAAVRAADLNLAAKPIFDEIMSDPKGMADIAWIVKEMPKPEEGVEAILRPAELKDNQVVYYKEGRPITIEFADKNIAALYKISTPEEANLLTKAFRGISTVTREFITHNPLFPVMNTISDAITSSIVMKDGSLPFHDFVKGVADAYTHGGDWEEFARNGGSGAAIRNFSRDYVKNDIEQLFAKTGTWDRVLNTPQNIRQKLGDWQEFLDTANRLGRYKRTRGGTVESRLEAAIGARKAYLDFQQKGASNTVNWFAAVTPFMRPAFLGLEQVASGFSTPQRAAISMAKISAFVVAPSVVLWAANMFMMGKDWAEKYQAMDKWTRDLYWIVPVPTPDGITAIRIKKPQNGLGLVGSYVERFLDWSVAKSPTATYDMLGNTIGAFAPNYIPAALQPFIETGLNRSTYTGHPLVSGALEGATGYMQYTANTSELAKKITNLIGPSHANVADMSPIMLEQFIRDWTGKPGMAVMHLLDAPLGAPAVPEDLAQNPFVAGFLVRNPGMNAAPISAFYDRAQAYRAASKDLSLAKGRLNEAELNQATSNQKLLAAAGVNQYSEALHNIMLSVNMVREDRKLTVDEKRQISEKLYLDARGIAAEGLNLMDQVENQK